MNKKEIDKTTKNKIKKVTGKYPIDLTDKQINWVAGKVAEEMTILFTIMKAVRKSERKDFATKLKEWVDNKIKKTEALISKGIAYDFDKLKSEWSGQILIMKQFIAQLGCSLPRK